MVARIILSRGLQNCGFTHSVTRRTVQQAVLVNFSTISQSSKHLQSPIHATTVLPAQSVLTTRQLCSDASPRDISAEIDGLVKQAKVVVFMKGVPDAPRCGFSNAVVQIMAMHDVKYEAHDVLADEVLRQGIKDFSNWPTIPQVYLDGEFVGGCDILLQMHQNGELVEELQKIGINSALLQPPKTEN